MGVDIELAPDEAVDPESIDGIESAEDADLPASVVRRTKTSRPAGGASSAGMLVGKTDLAGAASIRTAYRRRLSVT